MASTGGYAGQIGFKSESTVGTGVTVDQFIPFVSEAINHEIERLESKGIRAGRRTTHQWRAGKITIGGDVELDLPNTQFATVLKHMFGACVDAGAGPFTHTATPGDLLAKSMTVQIGVPDIGGTVRPFTLAGCKVPKWEISADAGEIAMLKLSLSAMTVTTATALASSSYSATWAPFHFIDSSISVGGSVVNTIKSFSLAADNGLDVTRHRLGSATIKEALEAGMRSYTGSITADFEDLTHYNRFVNATEFAIVATFSNGTQSLAVTTNARFDGTRPQLGGADDLSEIELPYKCISGTSDATSITALLTNSEATST